MNSKTTWTYVAIAAVVFALIVLVEQPARKKSIDAISTKVFSGFNPLAATRVEVRPTGQPKILAQRTNNSWILTSPLNYPAAESNIQSTLQALAQLDWHAYIAPSELKDRPKAHEEFGFATPLVSLSVEHGGSVLNLLIGTNTPVGEQLYLQVLGDVGVYVVDKEFLQFLPETSDDWRDTSVFRITNAITSIKSRANNKIFSLNRANGSWRMPQTRADDAKINALLRKTLELQIVGFETDDPQTDLERFGLQPAEMELTLAQDTNLLAVLQIGKSPTNDLAQVFAKLQNQNHIFRIRLADVVEWRGPSTNFVDRRLTSFAPEKIQQLEVRGGDEFVLQRADGGWKIPGATNLPVDSGLVRDVLHSLNLAEVDIEKEVVTDFPSYGLDPSMLRYTLRAADASSNSIVAQIDFGMSPAGKFFVRRLDEYPDTVKSISPEHFARLPQSSFQFRDRQIWKFTSNDVVSVVIEQKGQTRKFIRNAQGDWSFAPGSQGIINLFSFGEALHRLGDLKAVFWVAKGDSSADQFKFKEVDHRILIEIKRGTIVERLSLEFGGYSDFGTRYAATTLDGSKFVFEFPWPLFFEVQDSLTIPRK